MSELEQEISKTKDLKQALGILLADTISSSGTIKIKKDSVTGTVKVAEECVLAVGVEGAQPNTTATELLLELLSLEDALIEYQDIDEAFYPEGLTNTNMPIPMLLASNLSLKPEKTKSQTDGKARDTGEILKVFGDLADLEALRENCLILSEEELQELLAPSDIPEHDDEKKEESTERFELVAAQPNQLPACVLNELRNQLVDEPSYELRPELESNEIAFPGDFEKLRKKDTDNSSDIIYYIPDTEEASKAANKELTEKEKEALLEAQADAELEGRSQRKSSELSTSSLKASIHKSQLEEGEAQYQRSRKILIRGALAACIFGVLVLPLLQMYWSDWSGSSNPVKADSSSNPAKTDSSSNPAKTGSSSNPVKADSSNTGGQDFPSKRLTIASEPARTSKESYSASNEAPFQLAQGSSSGTGASSPGSATSPFTTQRQQAPLGFAYQKLHLSRAISKGKKLGVDTSGYSAALKSIENDRHAKKHQAELAAKMKALSTELDAQLSAKEPPKSEESFVGMGLGLPGKMPAEGAEQELYMSTKISSNEPLIVKGLHDSLQKSSSLKEGDRILAIDGVSVDGLSIYEVQNKLSGPTGTEVKITYKAADNSVNTVKLKCNNKSRL